MVPLLVLAAAAFALVAICTGAQGIGVSPDSTGYLSAGRSLARGEGYRCFTGPACATWPPLFPLVLAAGDLLGVDTVVWSRWINAWLLAVLALAGGTLLAGRVRYRPLAWLGVALAAVSPPILFVHFNAWSEPIFVLGVLVSLMVLARYLQTSLRRYLVCSAMAAALVCLTRYNGVFLLLSAAPCIVLLGKATLRRRLVDAGVFVTFGATPLAAWLVRNLVVVGSLTGERALSRVGLAENLDRVCRLINTCFLPEGVRRLTEQSPPATCAVALAAGAAVVAVLAAGAAAAGRRGRHDRHAYLCDVAPLAAYVAGFLALMIVSATLVAFDGLNNRLLCSICAPAIFALIIAADRLLDAAPSSRRYRLGRPVAVVLLVVVLGLTGRHVSSNVVAMARCGRGYSSFGWSQTALAGDIRQLDGRLEVRSNCPEAVWVLSGRAVNLAPFPAGRDRSPRRSWKAPLPDGRTAWLVWFSQPRYGLVARVTLRQLRQEYDLQPVLRRWDGTIYRIRRCGGQTAGASPRLSDPPPPLRMAADSAGIATR